MNHIYECDIAFIIAETPEEAMEIYKEQYNDDVLLDDFKQISDNKYFNILFKESNDGKIYFGNCILPKKHTISYDDSDYFYEDYKYEVIATYGDWAISNKKGVICTKL